MKTEPRDSSELEAQAGDELVAWFLRYVRRAPGGVLAGMLVSAAAELLTNERHATRELFIEIAGNAWDSWQKRRRTGRGEPS